RLVEPGLDLAQELKRQIILEVLVLLRLRFLEERLVVGAMREPLQKRREPLRIAAVESQRDILLKGPAAPAAHGRRAQRKLGGQLVGPKRLCQQFAQSLVPLLAVASLEKDGPIQALITQLLDAREELWSRATGDPGQMLLDVGERRPTVFLDNVGN